MKKAICIGINNYPGMFNDLKGCVNDANDWAELFAEFGFEVKVLLDKQGTRENIKAALRDLVSTLNQGITAFSRIQVTARTTAIPAAMNLIATMKHCTFTMGSCWMTNCAKSWMT